MAIYTNCWRVLVSKSIKETEMRRGGTDGERLMWYEHVIANCYYTVL